MSFEHLSIHPNTYDILKEQVMSNYPHESGGYVASSGTEIMGIYPVKNMQVYHQRSGKFSLPEGSYPKAKQYFDSHGLLYLGVYHSHPGGGLEPSIADKMNARPHRDRIQMIVGVDGYSIDIAIYNTKSYQRIPLIAS